MWYFENHLTYTLLFHKKSKMNQRKKDEVWKWKVSLLEHQHSKFSPISKAMHQWLFNWIICFSISRHLWGENRKYRYISKNCFCRHRCLSIHQEEWEEEIIRKLWEWKEAIQMVRNAPPSNLKVRSITEQLVWPASSSCFLCYIFTKLMSHQKCFLNFLLTIYEHGTWKKLCKTWVSV